MPNKYLIHTKKLRKGAILPTYATDGSGCFDLYFCQSDEIVAKRVEFPELEKQYEFDEFDEFLFQSAPKVFGTGLAFKIPENHVMLVFSRSGHAFKENIRLSNCVGVIDSDYRGEVMVKLIQDSSTGYTAKFKHSDRIAQAIIIPYNQVQFYEVDDIGETERGAGGFGSTGK